MTSFSLVRRLATACALALLVTAGPALAQERIGVAVDLFTESATMNGTQSIQRNGVGQSVDESFEYTPAGNLGATAWIHFLEGERVRWGPSLRYVGRYRTEEDADDAYDFGTLMEGFLEGEYSLPVVEKVHAVLGVRGGLALLIPQGDLKKEIDRLRADDVGVLNVPRTGWLFGLSVGARRALTESLAVRADFRGQWEQLYLFWTSDEVEGVDVHKRWTTQGLRFGVTLGLEFVL